MMNASLLSRETAPGSRPILSKERQPYGRNLVRTAKLIPTKPLVLEAQFPAIEPSESNLEYTIMVPTNGIDLRRIYVLAKPDSLFIEVRIRSSLKHQDGDAIVTEIEDQRVSRELRFRQPIEERGTSIEVRGRALQITCRKAMTAEEKSWSELLQFDTRASLGSV